MAASPRIYNILVVEDNSGDAHLIRDAFSECGKTCNLTFLDSLEKAEEALRTSPFDLVLSGIGVGNGECENFIRGIRGNSRLKSLPVIILSGSPNPCQAYEAGANAFVSKSMDRDRFFAKIQALMHFWVDIAELPPSS